MANNSVIVCITNIVLQDEDIQIPTYLLAAAIAIVSPSHNVSCTWAYFMASVYKVIASSWLPEVRDTTDSVKEFIYNSKNQKISATDLNNKL